MTRLKIILGNIRFFVVELRFDFQQQNKNMTDSKGKNLNYEILSIKRKSIRIFFLKQKKKKTLVVRSCNVNNFLL